MHDITDYIIHEQYIEDHRVDELRSGEGCIESLPDGSLLMIYGKFEGASDHDHATLLERRSTDGGVTWSEPKKVKDTPAGTLNVMSVSLHSIPDGPLVAVYLRKNSRGNCKPVAMLSDDGGKTFGDTIETLSEDAYFVVNNDRLVQLSTGRLLIPYAWHGAPFSGDIDSECGVTYSDDGGKTWTQAADRIAIKPENVLFPKVCEDKDKAQAIFDERGVTAQEPGVVELTDGRVMMWARSRGGYAYRADSADGGETWSDFQAIPDFPMPCGPQSIKRIPGSNRLIMLFNDRGRVPFEHTQFQWRRPLSVAVSDDDGQTWRAHGLLENPRLPTQCYFSICFHEDRVLFSYYEGFMVAASNDLYMPTNLRSLKLKVVKREYFEL